jgi:polysaccharide export outer membrane protein
MSMTRLNIFAGLIRLPGKMSLAFVLCFVLAAGQARSEDVKGYALGAGDKLRITVFNEPDLSGEFDVNGQGNISAPLLGDVNVIGRTTNDVRDILTDRYGKDYLVNPRVSVEVMNYRPFFILGEVNHPGSYPYVNGMTVISAVALAGGYTPRANRDRVEVKRASDPRTGERDVNEDAVILPGDIIQVPERFF